VRNQDTSFYLRWISLLFIIAAVILLIIQLVTYSRLKSNYPPGMTIAGVRVGGIDPQTASQRLIQVYKNTPVEIRLGDQVVHMEPSSAGYDINLDSMLAAADYERTGGAFWIGFWDYLWNRQTAPAEIPLVDSLNQSQLENYLKSEIAPRYDQPAVSAQPVAGSTQFQPGQPGQALDVTKAAVLIEDALRSPSNRTVTLPFASVKPPRPTLDNLKIQIQQIIDLAGFDGIVGFYLKDLQTGEVLHFVYQNGTWVSVNPDVAFTASSTIKIPIMIATYKNGGPKLDDQTQNLIKGMITKSDNPESDALMARLDEYRGPLIVTDTLRQLGIDNTYIAGYFKEGSFLLENIQTPANSRTDITTNPDAYNQVTPSDIGTLLEDLYQCAKTGGGALVAAFPANINQASCQEMIDTLKQDRIGVLIEAGIPDGTPLAHKHGWISGPSGIIQNISDAGIVYSPGGDYVLAIYVYHPVQAIWEPVSEMIAKMSEAVYNYFNITK
jgi:beta-lactamase class A